MRILLVLLVLAAPALGSSDNSVTVGATALSTSVTVTATADFDEEWAAEDDETDNFTVYVFSAPLPAGAVNHQWRIRSTIDATGSASASADPEGVATSGSRQRITLSGDHDNSLVGRMQVTAANHDSDTANLLRSETRVTAGDGLVACVVTETSARAHYGVELGACTLQTGSLRCNLVVEWSYWVGPLRVTDTCVVEDD